MSVCVQRVCYNKNIIVSDFQRNKHNFMSGTNAKRNAKYIINNVETQNECDETSTNSLNAM